jgi:hypothetical protein
MNEHEVALEITRLKIRCETHEALLSKLLLASWLQIPGTSLQEASRQTLSDFASVAKGLQNSIYSSDKYASFSDAEKALYSDEIAEIVGQMKSYVILLSGKKK